jgi:hypothetical protein
VALLHHVLARALKALAKVPARSNASPTQKQCQDFFRKELSYSDVRATQIEQDARAAGLSLRTLKRYKSRFGVKSVRRNDVWFWVAPEAGWQQ